MEKMEIMENGTARRGEGLALFWITIYTPAFVSRLCSFVHFILTFLRGILRHKINLKFNYFLVIISSNFIIYAGKIVMN